MPQPCTGFYYFGNRAWQCWEKEGHGSLDLCGAIAQSCDVYFYQLGQRITLSRLVAGGVGARVRQARRASTCPKRSRPRFPSTYPDYFNQKYGAARLDVGREGAEPGDRSGRERADRR